MSEDGNLALPAPPQAATQEMEKSVEQVLREKAPEVLNSIPPPQKAKLAQLTIHQESVSIRASPLPDPSELAAYNSIIPNGADRLLKMVEAQSAHRIDMERIMITSKETQASRGQYFGLIIGLAGLICATYAALKGQPAFGGTIGSVTLVSLVSVFVYGQYQKRQDLNQKRQETPPTLKKQNKRRGQD
jgi:uncharacterized membrane protein